MGVAAPSTFDGLTDTVTVLVLLVEFAMLRSALLRSQIRLYALQSLLVSALAAAVAAGRGIPQLYLLAAMSFLLKVVIVPTLMRRLLRRTGVEIAGSGALGIASEVVITLLVAGGGYFAVAQLHLHSAVLPSTALSLSMAVVLVAFMLMILRRDVVSQAVGFFSLENGVSVVSLVVAAGLPLILEVAFLFDLLVAVVVFGVLIRFHHARTSSLSTSNIDKLRG